MHPISSAELAALVERLRHRTRMSGDALLRELLELAWPTGRAQDN
jgi:hypothetical protein